MIFIPDPTFYILHSESRHQTLDSRPFFAITKNQGPFGPLILDFGSWILDYSVTTCLKSATWAKRSDTAARIASLFF